MTHTTVFSLQRCSRHKQGDTLQMVSFVLEIKHAACACRRVLGTRGGWRTMSSTPAIHTIRLKKKSISIWCLFGRRYFAGALEERLEVMGRVLDVLFGHTMCHLLAPRPCTGIVVPAHSTAPWHQPRMGSHLIKGRKMETPCQIRCSRSFLRYSLCRGA